ncbi:MAG TPA: 50S ribosomal protein L10 [Solirubrobacteraceae bacterium]|nr:50S ribosomal protein L10 [Solirubrobacteraceae bacterium]
MNRDQKAAAIAEIAGQIDESDAIFAVDYRGITVAQVAELRARLRDADATFKVVKNSLTERAADQVGADTLKDFLSGPTALTFVRGDVATAAKAVADYGRSAQLLPFKGGLMDGSTLDVEQIRSLSRLPSREVLYGQLVGVVASPVSGLVRTLNALLSGIAVALGQVHAKKESGDIPAPASDDSSAPASGDSSAPASDDSSAPASDDSSAAVAADESSPAGDDTAEEAPAAEAGEPPGAGEPPEAGDPPEEIARSEETAMEPPPKDETEPEHDEPAQAEDKHADVSAEAKTEDAETNPTKED